MVTLMNVQFTEKERELDLLISVATVCVPPSVRFLVLRYIPPLPQDSQSALHIASMKGELAIVTSLLEGGADPETQDTVCFIARL